MSHRYRAFGLAIESEFPLPELWEDQDAGAADLVIRDGILEERSGAFHEDVRPDVATIWVSEARAAYKACRGREIVVDAHGQSWDRDLRLYLLGSVLGAALHQRGLLPLHACALDFGGKAVAVLGHSGAGKSTLAAWLADRGGRLLSDDVCVVRKAEEGFSVAVGIPRLRLWREAIEARGGCPDDYPRSFADWDKHDVPLCHQDGPEQVPLTALFELGVGEEPDISSVSRAEAVELLSANTYRGSYVRLMNRTAAHFEQCIRLAEAVPLQRFTRPLDFARMEKVNDALLAKIRQLTGWS